MIELICLGDSLTYGPGVANSKRWTTLIASQRLVVHPMGVSGDTTGGMLARLQPLLQKPVLQLAPALRPMVLILGGSNDIFFTGSTEAAQGNLAAMVHQLSAAGYRPLVGIPLPIYPEDAPEKWAQLADFAKAAALLEEYSQWLKRFCLAFDIPVVDFRKDYVNQDKSVRRELFLDGLHPNAEGHRLMAQRLLEALSC
jgi:lysophospholipase L1-like esterase